MMMGERQVDQGALFYEFSLERQVPAVSVRPLGCREQSSYTANEENSAKEEGTHRVCFLAGCGRSSCAMLIRPR